MDHDPYEALAGRLLVGLAGAGLTDGERRILRDAPPAGVVLFDRNITGAEQLVSLTSEIDSIVRGAAGLKPLIAADHEGGRISVLAGAIGVPPSQMAIARVEDRTARIRAFTETARRMLGVGVGMVLGPVVDINSEYRNPVIGTRSFGEDAAIVSELGGESIEAYKRAGILTCIKHFPGHGGAALDSHLTLPMLGSTVEELEERDLVPFVSGIASGADSIMTGHVVPADRIVPASLDGDMIGTIIRGRWRFDGVVITDALEMEGVLIPVRGESAGSGSLAIPEGEALDSLLVAALEAGNDLLLFSRPLEEVADAVRRSGGRAAERASVTGADSLERIGRLRGELGGAQQTAAYPPRRGADAGAGEPDTRVSAGPYGDIAYRAVRATAPGGSSGPMLRGGRLRLDCYGEIRDFTSAPVRRFVERLGAELFAGEAAGRFSPVTGLSGISADATPVWKGGTGPHGIEIYDQRYGAAEGERIAVLVNRRPFPREALEELCGGAGIAVVAGWPYAARFLPEGMTSVITYGPYDAAAAAAARILRGARFPRADSD